MKLYIASTSGYSGKTLLALGLSRVWSGGGVSVGYVKPLGEIPGGGEGSTVVGGRRFSRPSPSRHHLLPGLPGPAGRPVHGGGVDGPAVVDGPHPGRPASGRRAQSGGGLPGGGPPGCRPAPYRGRREPR